MFKGLLDKLDTVFLTLIGQMEYIVSMHGTDYSKYSEAEQNRVAMAMSVAGAIKKVLDTPILNEDGSLNDASNQVHLEISKYHENVQAKLA